MLRSPLLLLGLLAPALAAPLTIVTSSIPAATAGRPYQFVLQAGGGTPPYTWTSTMAGDGFSLDASGNLQGTPRTAEVLMLHLSVKDAAGATALKDLPWTIAGPLKVYDSGAQIQLKLGTERPYQFLTDSLASLSIVSGRLPNGTRIATQDYGGVIVASLVGAPTEGGGFFFTLSYHGFLGDSTTANYVAMVDGMALTVTLNSSFSFGVGKTATVPWTVVGGTPPYQTTLAGTLPDGMTANTAAGNLSGVPTRAGIYNVTVSVTDLTSARASTSTTITVTSPLTVSTAPLPAARNNNPYNATLGVSGGSPPYSWRSLTTLPAGLTLSAAGALSGVVTAAAGAYDVHAVVTDSGGAAATLNGTLTVDGPIIGTTPLSNARVGVAYAQALPVSGGARPYTWSMPGGRLPGLALDAATGILAGTPTAAGSYPFTVQVVDTYGSSAIRTLSVTVDTAALTIAAPALPAGNVGSTYQASLSGAGGVPPYQFALDSGVLPDGLTLSAAGTLGGAPKQKGSWTFVVRCADASGQVAKTTLTLQVLGAIPAFTAASVLNGASFRPGIAPGEYVSIFGSNLAPETAVSKELPLPTTAAGVTVRWNGAALPLLAVSPGQINAQVPFDVTPGTWEMTITSDGVTSAKIGVQAQAASPGLFEAQPGVLLAINQDGTLNSQDHPAAAGSIVVFYATGAGVYDGALRAGDATAVDRLYRLALPSSVAIGDAVAEVLFAGAAPALGSGLAQLNVQVPDVSTGKWPVVLKVGGVASNSAALWVTGR